jgi:hypothetical protein
MIGMNDAPDLQAILNETLQDIENVIEAQVNEMIDITKERDRLTAKYDQLDTCRKTLIDIRGRLASKLPA